MSISQVKLDFHVVLQLIHHYQETDNSTIGGLLLSDDYPPDNDVIAINSTIPSILNDSSNQNNEQCLISTLYDLDIAHYVVGWYIILDRYSYHDFQNIIANHNRFVSNMTNAIVLLIDISAKFIGKHHIQALSLTSNDKALKPYLIPVSIHHSPIGLRLLQSTYDLNVQPTSYNRDIVITYLETHVNLILDILSNLKTHKTNSLVNTQHPAITSFEDEDIYNVCVEFNSTLLNELLKIFHQLCDNDKPPV